MEAQEGWRAGRRGLRLRPAAERGSALLVLVFATLSLTAMAVAYVVGLPVTLRDMRERHDLSSARLLALGAEAEAERSLRTGGTGNLDGNAKDGTLTELPASTGGGGTGPVTGSTGVAAIVASRPSGSFAARARTLADGTTLIETAAIDGGVLQHLARVVRRISVLPYTHALFARTSIDGRNGELMADSYDSRLGRYTDQAVNEFVDPNDRSWIYARNKAQLGADGSIALPDGVVLGDVHPGPGSSYVPSPGTYVTGSTAPSAATLDPQVATYAVPTQTDNANLGSLLRSGNTFWAVQGDGDAIVPSGTYVVDSFWAYQQRVRITGDVKLYVRGTFYIGREAVVRVEEGASLSIYADGAWVYISGDGLQNRTRVPANIRLYATADPTGQPAAGDTPPTIFLDGSRPFIGTIYAPESPVEFYRQDDFRGAVVADRIVLDGTRHRIHYDEALSQVTDVAPESSRYETVAAWRLGP